MKKKVLVYPCGTEIGLEIFRAVGNSIHFELIGGSSSYDHGRFVYENHIDDLPFITDKSDENEIIAFNKSISELNIDYIYPAMDGVLTKFSDFRALLDPIVIAPEKETAVITRSKSKTYDLLKDVITVPKVFNVQDKNLTFPLFIKPDVGQGSRGAMIIKNNEDLKQYGSSDMLLLEYLPGEEYTIDCFTNASGQLVYAGGRTRKRVKGGISVNAIEDTNPKLIELAKAINAKLDQRGGWFFQVKKNALGNYSLLEVASRIAGTSSFTRNMGVNLPLLTLHMFNGGNIDGVIKNNYTLELDRALYNKFKVDLDYDKVYIDFDDTVLINDKINLQLIAFIYQCINENIPVILITKHDGDINKKLVEKKLSTLFDEVIHLTKEDDKYKYIQEEKAIFIDDSYGERYSVHKKRGINVFDTHMIECLLKEHN